MIESSMLLPVILSMILLIYWLIYIYPERGWDTRDLSKMSINTDGLSDDISYYNDEARQS